MRSENNNDIHPTLLKLALGGVSTAIVLFVGISTIMDHKNAQSYQDWARQENQKVFDQSQQIRLSEKQLSKMKKQLNDSFYERLSDGLPVRVLIVGDAYGAGYGASNKSAVWSKQLANQLKHKYGCNVEITDLSLSGMNGCYSAWAQLMAQPDGTAEKVLTDAKAVKSENGIYTGEGVDNKILNAARENEYDLCIVSLGMTDDSSMFIPYYEGILRELRNKYQKCSVISLLSNQAMTAPDMGMADENYDSLYSISDHYKASVVNIGLEMVDPEASSRGATASEISYGSITSESLSDSMQADGISGKKAKEIADDDLRERTAKAEEKIEQYTIDRLFLNNDGQKFVAETLVSFIDKKVKKQVKYDSANIEPLSEAAVTLDKYHYFPSSQLKKLDDFTYILPENTLASAAADLSGIVGVDYKLVSGDNDIYLATGNGTDGLGRITIQHSGDDKERYITPVNDGYSLTADGAIRISFATRAQASTLNGVIIGGDFTLPSYFDDYTSVPYIGPADGSGNPIPIDADGNILDKSDSTSESTAPSTTAAASVAQPTVAQTTAAHQETQTQSTEEQTVSEYVESDEQSYEENSTEETQSESESITDDTNTDADASSEDTSDSTGPSAPETTTAAETEEESESTDDSADDGTVDDETSSDEYSETYSTYADTSNIKAGQALSEEQRSSILSNPSNR